jgi:hypothetical protein
LLIATTSGGGWQWCEGKRRRGREQKTRQAGSLLLLLLLLMLCHGVCQSSQPSVLFTALVTPPQTPFVPLYFNAPLPLFLHGYGHNDTSTLSCGWLLIK